MSIEKPPPGTRGGGAAPGWVGRLVTPLMVRLHRLMKDRFNGMDLLYLTTVGARSGGTRTTPVARFDNGAGGWWVVASAGGAKTHPAWYHNVAAHPDLVSVEVRGQRHRVSVEQLDGPARDHAWAEITHRAGGFRAYETKTDRVIPVLSLTPLD